VTLRIGTRGSALAMSQAGMVARQISEQTGMPTELVPITTAGDTSNAPVARLGVGVFVSALREALVDKEVDLAVHSYKDLPTAPDDRLQVVAVPPRVDPRDALVTPQGRGLADLPPGARVGTGAPRRIAQLHALGRGLVPVPVRGNVDSRLARVTSGELDALLLASAGLIRLGRADVITETLDPAVLLPAPAQGALAVECRADDQYLLETLAALDHLPSRAAVVAERTMLATLEAGCSAPVAGYAELTPTGAFRLTGAVIALDGTRSIRHSRIIAAPGTGPELIDVARRLGEELAADLLAAGAQTIMAARGPGGAEPTRSTGEHSRSDDDS
jgi:hydroxymethylbilane synthase